MWAWTRRAGCTCGTALAATLSEPAGGQAISLSTFLAFLSARVLSFTRMLSFIAANNSAPGKKLTRLFAFLFRILTDAAISQMNFISDSNCTQVSEVESCHPSLVCAARAVHRTVSRHSCPCDPICAAAITLLAFQPIYKLLLENACARAGTSSRLSYI